MRFVGFVFLFATWVASSALACSPDREPQGFGKLWSLVSTGGGSIDSCQRTADHLQVAHQLDEEYVNGELDDKKYRKSLAVSEREYLHLANSFAFDIEQFSSERIMIEAGRKDNRSFQPVIPGYSVIHYEQGQ